MPSPRRYRLLAPLPLTVAFKSVSYRLDIAQVPVSGLWQLEARFAGGFWLCDYASSEEALRKAVYVEGLEFADATVPRVIFERLVKEGRWLWGDRQPLLTFGKQRTFSRAVTGGHQADFPPNKMMVISPN